MNSSEARTNPLLPRRPIAILSAFALVLLLQLFATLPAMEFPGTLMDEGMLLYYPELLGKGLIPQRDFESMYPPGNIWFLAGAYSLFGTSVQTERLCALLFQIALTSGFFVLLSRWSLKVAVAGGILCLCALLPLNLVAFAWVGGSAFALWAVVAISARGRPETRGALAGGLAALALTWRVDLAPAVILSLAGYCILARWKMRPVLWLMGTAAVVLLPLLAHVLKVSPSAFINGVFLKPVLTCSHGRTLPLDFSRALIGQLYTLLLISTGLALFAGWRAHRTAGIGNPALIAAGLLSLGALPQALMRPDITHLSFVTPLALPLLAVALSILFSHHKLTPALAVVSVFLLLPQTAEMLRTRLAGQSSPAGSVFTLHSGDRSFPVANMFYAKASQEVLTHLSKASNPGETLFIGPNDLRFAMGNDLFLYHLLPWLNPCSYYLEMNPLSPNLPGSGLAEQVAQSDWLILSSYWSTLREPNASQIPGPATPNEVVRERFDLVFSHYPFEIYKRRGLVGRISHSPEAVIR